MTKSTTDHVHYDATDSEVRCRHCEDRTSLSDGSTAELLVMRLRGFLLMHKLCQPRPVPSPQLALPGTDSFTTRHGDRIELGEDDCSPPINPIAAEQGREMAGEDAKPATTWVQLWPQLREALAPHEYNACAEHTEFVESFSPVEWAHMARWVALEIGAQEGTLEPRPPVFAAAVYRAVAEAQKRHAAAAKAAPAKPRKPRARKASAPSIPAR